MKPIESVDYEVLMSYRELLDRHRRGHQVTVTAKMWADIYNVVTRYYQYRGSRTCAFCVTELLNLANIMIDSYEKEG